MQRTCPSCQDPVKAVRGVRGADTRQIIMSETAMLQMYMLELVLSSGLLVEMVIIRLEHSWSHIQMLPTPALLCHKDTANGKKCT